MFFSKQPHIEIQKLVESLHFAIQTGGRMARSFGLGTSPVSLPQASVQNAVGPRPQS